MRIRNPDFFVTPCIRNTFLQLKLLPVCLVPVNTTLLIEDLAPKLGHQKGEMLRKPLQHRILLLIIIVVIVIVIARVSVMSLFILAALLLTINPLPCSFFADQIVLCNRIVWLFLTFGHLLSPAGPGLGGSGHFFWLLHKNGLKTSDGERKVPVQ
jgi:hypothetical protein